MNAGDAVICKACHDPEKCLPANHSLGSLKQDDMRLRNACARQHQQALLPLRQNGMPFHFLLKFLDLRNALKFKFGK